MRSLHREETWCASSAALKATHAGPLNETSAAMDVLKDRNFVTKRAASDGLADRHAGPVDAMLASICWPAKPVHQDR